MFYQQCMKKCGHQIIQISFTNITNKWSGLNWICGNYSIFESNTPWIFTLPFVCPFVYLPPVNDGKAKKCCYEGGLTDIDHLMRLKETNWHFNGNQQKWTWTLKNTKEGGPVWTGSCCSNALLPRFSNKDNVRLGLKIVASSQFPALFLFMNWSNFVNKAGLRMQPPKCNRADVTNELHNVLKGLPNFHGAYNSLFVI